MASPRHTVWAGPLTSITLIHAWPCDVGARLAPSPRLLLGEIIAIHIGVMVATSVLREIYRMEDEVEREVGGVVGMKADDVGES